MFGGAKQTFGQTPTTSAFGFNNTTAAAPFGQSTFGKPQQNPGFGQTAAFGQQNTSLFGGAQSTSLFGTANPTPAFGSTVATTQSGFGGVGFGQPQQNASLFGSPQTNANTSLFGAPANANAFGAAKPNNFGFAANQPTTSLFAQASTSTTANTGFFGQNATTGGLFGSATPSFGGAAPGANGTAVAKYQPSLGTDTLVKNGQQNSVSTKQHCITAMKEYEGKSLEELRMEDYAANRKGPPVGQPATLFGTAAPSTGIFGAQPAQQPSTGLFGQTTEKQNLFSQQGNLNFGQTAPAFGGNNTQATSLFAKPFNSAAITTSSFGFNNTTTNTNPFGAKPFGTTTTSGLFGQPATSTAPSFGQPTTGFGSFGTTNANQPLFGADKPAFMAPTSNTGFPSFGTTNTNTTNNGLFGAKPNTNFTFGQPIAQTNPGFQSFGQPTGGSLFNPTFNKPATQFGAFGAQTSVPSMGQPIGGGTNTLFGNPANKPGLFGNTTGQPGGLFSNNSAFSGNTLGNFGTNMMGTANTGLNTSNQINSYPVHQQIMALTTSPYGDTALFKDLKSRGITEESLKPTNPAAQKAFLESTSNQFKMSPKIGNTINIRPIGGSTKKSLFEGLEEYDSTVEESFNLTPNVKRLILNTNSLSTNRNLLTTKHKSPLITTQNRQSISSVQTPPEIQKNQFETSEVFQLQIPNTPPVQSDLDTPGARRVSWLQSNILEKGRQTNRPNDLMFNNTISELVPEGISSLPPKQREISSQVRQEIKDSNRNNSPTARFNAHTSIDSIISNRTLDESQLEIPTNIETHPTGIVLTRPGYYTIPSMDDLVSYLSEDGTCVVPNFTIGREGYGNVFYNEPIDVADLNLDQIVHFRHKEITIYADDDNKPPVGSGLNRKAQITLDQVWPYDKTLHEPIKDSERLSLMDYEGKLRRVCDKHFTRFIDYRPESGSWVFRVDHFSKYGLSDSDEEDESPIDPKKAKLLLHKKSDIQKQSNKIKEGTIPKSNFSKFLSNDEPMMNRELSASRTIEVIDIDDEISMDFMQKSNQRKTVTSPSIELAMDMGSDSHKLQLMKASFFADDDYSGKSTPFEGFSGRSTPDQIVPIKPILKQSDIFNNPTLNLTQLDSIESSTKKDLNSEDNTLNILSKYNQMLDHSTNTLIVKPKTALVEIPGTVIPLCDSIIQHMKISSLSDSAFMHGRYFRVGWGLKNSLFVLNTSNNCQILKRECNLDQMTKFLKGRSNDDSSITLLQNIRISSSKNIEFFEKSIEEHLKIQLKYSTHVESELGGCIQLISEGSTKALEEHFELSKKLIGLGDMEKYASTVWSLCCALWGEREELENQETNNHFTIMCRRELFSDWLELVTTDDNLLEKSVTKLTYLNHLLDLLKCHKVIEACELAFTNNDINMSLLLAQISGGPAVRQLMQHQLSSWQDVDADKFIAIERLKALMLVAGVPILSSSHGSINIFDNIDWIKSLALCLWYMCSPTSSITDALIMYEKSFEAIEFYACPPTPPYSDIYKPQSSKQLQDLRFHLLKLYSKRSHSMESLLNPATHTADTMDYRLSWLMLQNLESLGYHHCSELSESQLHVSFASQLETQGLWHWSIFVLLHIKNQPRREICVQQILYRYIEITDNDDYLDKEKFILDLGVSENWLFWAKAVKAGSIKDYHVQANYLLQAKQWSLAHEVVMSHIAPDAIVNDHIPYIKSLLNRFEDPKQISNWTTQGQMLLDYIDISEKFENLKTVGESDLELLWEELKPQLAELCSRINQFPCPTSKHRLCQSEIAQKLSCLVRGVLLTSPSVNPCLLIKIALEKLPLPQEYAQQELRVLLDTYSGDNTNHQAMDN